MIVTPEEIEAHFEDLATAAEMDWLPLPIWTCRACGCTDLKPCYDGDHRPCAWVEDDLCSGCEGVAKRRLT